MTYAEKTEVSVERSEAELKALLRKNGADQIVTGFDDASGRAVINFRIAGRAVRLEVIIPTTQALEQKIVKLEPRGWSGWTPKQRRDYVAKQRDQIERQRWRALVLITKAKLEIVSQGFSTFEREFLADLLLPDGSTVHGALAPKIERAYLEGKMPKLLPGLE